MNFSKEESEKIYFCADPHFNHESIIKFCNRPFSSVKEMNETLIKNWNAVVPDDGIVFLVGDVGFGESSELRSIINRLKGKIYLIPGNHDKRATHKDCITRFEVFNPHKQNRTEKDYMISVEDEDASKGIQKIVLYHYATVDWDCKFHGSWHLHGHSHQTIVPTAIGKLLYEMKIIDVGVDGHNFTPLSYQQVKKIMSNRKTHF